MKYLSLFSGIGGFELGIEQAYEKRYLGAKPTNEKPEQTEPEIQLRGERTTLEEELCLLSTNERREWPVCVGYSEIDKYAIQIYEKHFKHKKYGNITKIDPNRLPDFDLLCGGFPCQSFSIAGKRGGFEDTRGTLFFNIADIAKHKRPRYLLLENVKGLLSHDNGRTFNTIITTLTDLGYDLEWQVLNSKNFGVPQNRERVFIIGYFGGRSGQQVFPIGESNSKNLNQLVGGGQGNRLYGTDGISTTIASQAGGQGAKTGLYAVGGTQKNAARMKDQSPALTEAMGQGGGHIPIVNPNMKIRRLTPTECERLQGFPDGWTEGVSDTQRYKTLGNAVTVSVVQAIMEKLL